MYWRNKKKRAEIRVVVGLTKKNKNTNRLQYALNWLTLTDQHLDSETNAIVHKTKISKCHCNASFIRARQIEESRLHPRHRSMCQREVFTIRSYPWRRALNALSFAVWSETSVPRHQKCSVGCARRCINTRSRSPACFAAGFTLHQLLWCLCAWTITQ